MKKTFTLFFIMVWMLVVFSLSAFADAKTTAAGTRDDGMYNNSTNANNYRTTATTDNSSNNWGWLGLLGLLGLTGLRKRNHEKS
jgi:MYXO-CTERM domain-containing protein